MKRAADASRPDRRAYVSLRGRAEFSRVYRQGARRRVGDILMISLVDGSGPPKVGFVAGRRVGNAVARNRAKRRMREAVARAGLPQGSSHVIVAVTDLAEATFAELVTWLKQGAKATRREEHEA